MNSEEGFSIPQGNETQIRGSWVSTTPKMPILQRSNPIPVNRQGNQLGCENWQELKEIYGGFLQETTNYKEMLHSPKTNGLMDLNGGCYTSDFSVAEKGGFNLNVASHTQTFDDPLAELLAVKKVAAMAPVNGALSKTIQPTYTPITQNSNSQVGSNWTNSSSTGSSHANQSCAFGSRQRSNGGSLQQFTQENKIIQRVPNQSVAYNFQTTEGFPVPYWPGFDLNSPPTSQADAASSITNSSQFAPVTPDKVKQFETHRCSEIPNFCEDENPCQAKDLQENVLTSTESEAIKNRCDEPSYNTLHSSPVAISTPLKGKNDSDQGGEQYVEQNKTPQQRVPKRRKHRPKVVVEGKLKRTPNTTIPKNGKSKENSTGKRKYMRKNGLKATDSQQPNVLETTAPKNINSRENPPAKRKYVRKNGLKASDTQRPNVFKTTTPDNRNSKENPPGKRKYVHNNGLKSSETQLPNFFSEVTIHNVGSAEKSCRRALNFNLENETADGGEDKATSLQAEMHEEIRADSQATDISTRINSGIGIESAIQMQQQQWQAGYVTGNQQRGITCNPNHSMNQMFARCTPLQESCAPVSPPAPIKDHTLNVIARHLNMRNSTQCQYSGKNGYTQVHRNIHNEELSKIVFQKNTSHENLERASKLMWQSTPRMVMQDAANSYEKRGYKREYCHTMEHTDSHSRNLNGNRLCKTYRTDYYNRNSSNFVTCSPETNGERKSENGFHSTISSMPRITAVKDNSRQITNGRNDAYTNCSASAFNSRILNSYLECDKTSKMLNNWIDGTAGDWHTHTMSAQHNCHKQFFSSEQYLQTERMADKRKSGGFIQVNDFITYPTAMTNSNFLASIHTKKAPTSDHLQEIDACKANMSAKYTESLIPSNPDSRTDEVLPLQHIDMLHVDQQSSMKTRGAGSPEKQKNSVPIDDITHRLKGLNIDSMTNRTQENALVPYQGDGTIIQYEGGLNPIKRRKPRPKVDLDPETNRIWKLLMGKEGREDGEIGGKDKERWWEEERKVFHGRVDSFIARMHLVQGDRRFSKWKGSVVDSVIGVFLTQNVSDHLSSSAFMSLAARFPLPRATTNLTCYQSGTSIFIEEPEVIDPDVAISHEKIASQPFQILSCQTSHESPEHGTVKFTSGTEKRSPTNEQCRRAEVIASQNLFGSFLLQTNGETRSYSGSKSEAEDPTTVLKPNQIHNSPPSDLLHAEENTMLQELNNHVTRGSLLSKMSTHEHEHEQLEDTEYNRQIPRLNKVDNLGSKSSFTCSINSNNPHFQGTIVPSNHMASASEAPVIDCFGVPRDESKCYLPSTASGIMKTLSVENIRDKIPNGVPRTQAPTMSPSAFIRNYHTHHEPVPNAAKDQFPIKAHQQERSRAYQLESTLDREPIYPAKAPAKVQTYIKQQVSTEPKLTGQTLGMEERISVVESEKYLENKEVEAKAKEPLSSSHEPFSAGDTNILISEKGKTEGDQSERFDWDSLRKKVQQNGRRKERNKDTMDTLDYEAVRRADTREISNAIKERGMNNMLAARIKDFLNRLVRDHGSIDLEWLRDVPPDKAKDYLLSIRGLGLKSAECVRLLTLHHLAFPVDTNVGRIAVRLGWVPLQPLPESLQLHLLELYPMLESIQKYLWPRLCKLDQQTLYELHYQMITFGKVFCTKSKPNCNACPMRGECRHFASAFASARLALPGPEDKSIVSSSIPAPAEKDPAMKIQPMPLPPAGNNAPKEAGFISSKCEPIVEEPASPEPEPTGGSESDTEDSFYEAPEEIPTIKLNIEEFTITLQNYMQENMELREGDMSKALVALNPDVASIPTPMLKNVSRLRTEHQVYELPDSHPLLKALDERQPDDPSPYLLAIWTPGETASSTQPPQRCESQESGKLCNEKTCFSCNSIREENSGTVRGTLLVPCRTAMRGSFPLNGTYFQVNEVFADHESSLNPIDVPRAWIWNLPRRTVYFGTSVSTIFRGLSTKGIQYCFWRGFVCVRGFDQTTRAPRPLVARLHFPVSKLAKTKDKN